ncbi:hypothetical protein SISSUDRAFT_351717 [Sistotremastrum suecicum HHB10207 ss-3]|uniref:Uncharacterized protein n=1 Tax=Sistotremastrum suecicum HHB10207 ss-3 TaxID=1314776 RepID=A0A166G367_9AGAM|nr:hypothetical protein SISSUDRAFT_351717 [Sistotremastrum suecicum HHB10207 ss-3]
MDKAWQTLPRRLSRRRTSGAHARRLKRKNLRHRQRTSFVTYARRNSAPELDCLRTFGKPDMPWLLQPRNPRVSGRKNRPRLRGRAVGRASRETTWTFGANAGFSAPSAYSIDGIVSASIRSASICFKGVWACGLSPWCRNSWPDASWPQLSVGINPNSGCFDITNDFNDPVRADTGANERNARGKVPT